MLTEERQRYILRKIQIEKIVKIKDLIEEMEVSESTVKRDLDDLEQKGMLKRVRGGAIPVKELFTFDEPISMKKTKFLDEKIRIGKFCASLVEDGEFIYIDAGTTTNEIIPFLKGKDITVVTNGIYNAERLLENDIKTMLIGGEIKGVTRAVIGEQALNQLRNFRFTKSFIGANGVMLKSGITTPDISEAVIKREAIKNSKEPYVVVDASKFDNISYSKICDLNEVNIVTTIKKDDIDDRILKQSDVYCV